MEPEDFEKMEELFRKLEGYIGQRICLISGIADGVQIGAYTTEGKLLASVMDADIKKATEKLKQSLQT